MVTAAGQDVSATVGTAIDTAAAALFGRQRPDGSWQDHLPSAAISTATSVVALHYADPAGSADLIAAGLRWLRDSQLPGGGWGDAPGAPATMPASAFALAALTLLAPAESAPGIRRARAWIDSQGGMAAVADPERCALHVLCLQFLALAGLYDQNRIRPMPVAVALLPRRLRRKVSFVVPVTLSWTVMQRHTWRFGPLTRAVLRVAEPRAFRYFDELTALEPEGGGSQESPLLVSMICFAFARAGQRPDLVRRGVTYLHRTVRADGSWAVNRDLEFSATAFVCIGLQDSGHGHDPRLGRTREWLRASQWTTAFPPTGCPDGGWAWSVESGWPNSDDTANALTVLAGWGSDADDTRAAAGVRWLLAMQNRNGSWSCFSRDNHVALDAPCAVITSHAVTAIHAVTGMTAQDRPMARAVRWFGRAQQPDGSVPCLWYRDSTAGTARTLEALALLGLGREPVARRCTEWLLGTQNGDGGWGDGRGARSSAEETAWALTGLLSAGVPPDGAALTRAACWLASQQQASGLWTPTILGVYFLDLWYSDDLLASGYALQALGRYQRARRKREVPMR
ncbi:MAG TPA: prenyltransferase/squalene oxidase repeat-containing protein [Streptosporangiaceae bacterium]|nr:prenyltransferase/squalene oxidase repeat-containing protein [Streptosporangiaceae bacterium]